MTREIIVVLALGFLVSTARLDGQGVSPNKKSQTKVPHEAHVQAGTVQAAVDAYVRGDMNASFSDWHRLADEGNTFAQTSIALMFFQGEGTQKDSTEGQKYKKVSISQGDPTLELPWVTVYDASFIHGVTDGFLKGLKIKNEKTERDYVEAAACFRKSAEGGHPVAERILGNFYLLGLGVPPDVVQATAWLAKAADGNDILAMLTLAGVYQKGLPGVPADPHQALNYYKKAADQGSPLAMADLGSAYAKGTLGEKNYSTAEWWYLKFKEKDPVAGEKDLRDLYDTIGNAYLRGDGVSKDPSQAAKWFRKAADAGDASAAKKLADLYRNGEGVPKEYAEADRWSKQYVELLQKDVERGNGSAKDQIADVFAESRSRSAKSQLADVFAEGKYAPKDYGAAARLYREVVEKDPLVFKWDLAKLACLYENGQGVTQDVVQAYIWFNLAAGYGWTSAKEDRDRLERSMTREQVAEAQTLSREWRDKHQSQTELPIVMQQATASPTSDDSVTSAIDRVRSAPHSILPDAQKLPAGTGNGVQVENATKYSIRIYFRGPEKHAENVPPGGSVTINLPPGEYEVAAEVPNSSVQPYYGKQEYSTGSGYRERFTIETRF